MSRKGSSSSPAPVPANQANELEIRRQELVLHDKQLELDKQKDRHQYEVAMKSMEHMAEDNQGYREAVLKNSASLRWFVLAVITLIIAALAYALHLGKESVVIEIAKLAVAFLGGGGLGYGYARSRPWPSPPSDDN